MGTTPNVREAEFRNPALKGRADSGSGGEKSSRRTPKTEDVRGMPRGAGEDRQVLERHERRETRAPETCTGRHDPGGS
ncbi:hypothetical protein NDU88_002414 [Pleurodeles waltl]|uniref:Uncharacterized protein n=1 Tax=Pleurodeles waltl TaxID=8319 RepID=A0AAV7T214_PLEWA|nr:hypothetical protein NDU88_002414 [Pleurodeles waltl]